MPSLALGSPSSWLFTIARAGLAWSMVWIAHHDVLASATDVTGNESSLATMLPLVNMNAIQPTFGTLTQATPRLGNTAFSQVNPPNFHGSMDGTGQVITVQGQFKNIVESMSQDGHRTNALLSRK